MERAEERINQALADMWKKGEIGEVLKNELKSQGGQPPSQFSQCLVPHITKLLLK